MKEEKSVGMDAMPEDKIHRYEFRNLENRVTNIEKTINVLTILCNEYAKRNGIKVEKFQNGIVVISQM